MMSGELQVEKFKFLLLRSLVLQNVEAFYSLINSSLEHQTYKQCTFTEQLVLSIGWLSLKMSPFLIDLIQ